MDYSADRVIQALLDHNVPPSLMSMDRAAPLEKKALRGNGRGNEEESSAQKGSGSGGGKRANSLAFQSRGKRRRKERDSCSSERYMIPHDNDSRQFEQDVGQIRESHLKLCVAQDHAASLQLAEGREGGDQGIGKGAGGGAVDMEKVRRVCASTSCAA